MCRLLLTHLAEVFLPPFVATPFSLNLGRRLHASECLSEICLRRFGRFSQSFAAGGDLRLSGYEDQEPPSTSRQKISVALGALRQSRKAEFCRCRPLPRSWK